MTVVLASSARAHAPRAGAVRKEEGDSNAAARRRAFERSGMPQLEGVRLQRCCLDDARFRPLGRCLCGCHACAVPCLLPRRPASLTDAVRAPVQATKSYVPQEFRVQLKREGQARRAFFAALKDSTRTRITKSELCSFTWSFRFKRNAGKVVLKPVLDNANESTATRRAAQARCRCHTRALLHVARAHTSLRACTRMRACSNAHANAHSRMAHAHARMRRRGQKKIRTGPACLLGRSSLPHILCQKTPL